MQASARGGGGPLAGVSRCRPLSLALALSEPKSPKFPDARRPKAEGQLACRLSEQAPVPQPAPPSLAQSKREGREAAKEKKKGGSRGSEGQPWRSGHGKWKEIKEKAGS